jgi:hypothetical protein
MRGSNYPDNIRSFDHDPRSPFYRDYQGEAEEAAIEAFENEWSTMLARMDTIGFRYKIDAEDIEYCEYKGEFEDARLCRVCPDTGEVYGAAVDPEDVDAFLANLGDVPDALARLTHYFDTGEE